MIVCVNGNGQGCCDICLHLKGWHREWSTSLYYIKNNRGLYLRVKERYGDIFSNDDNLRKAVFCYRHALEVNDVRKHQPGYDEG